MDKRFDNKEEDKIYADWLKSGYFNPDQCIKDKLCDKDADTFSIILPPPNVTGTLHMGHASMLVLEDIMIRFNRMQGKRTLWVPGTDHAAIATQSKVEKDLYKKEGKTRHDLGRDKFLKLVNKFAQESHDTIVTQIKKMGASVDWTREAFTLDDDRSEAVTTAFQRMYDASLINQNMKVINWCPKCGSTLADDEVEHEDKQATLYTFKYDKDFPIPISTTRPETKLGDTAVAVHPKDKRYQQYIDQEFSVNFLGVPLTIKIVTDEGVDKDFGTGALGVTPAHSKIDEEIALKNNLPSIQIIGEDGRLTDKAGEFAGLRVKKAREAIIEQLQAQKLISKEEEVSQSLSVCYRCHTAVEPLPKLQWFIDVNKEFKMGPSKIKGIKTGDKVTLKQLMKTVVTNGQIKIIPKHFEKVYFHWINNLRPWCISRQIWYGHQIPVWTKDNKTTVGTKPTGSGWTQDPDTLDTWFSSGLWTFSTLGWPKQTPDLKAYHPTNVMETGYDILFFWVARMILMTTFLLGDIPFSQVYLHGLVRDAKGRKMSKSLNNGIDPLDMIDKFGADATRLSLVIGVGAGNDLNLSEDKVRSYRNFTTKIWNVARFISMNKPADYNSESASLKLNKQHSAYLKELTSIKKEITKHYEKFEFHLAGEKAYHYFWHTLADVIIEEVKSDLKDGNQATQHSVYYLLETILFECLKMLHPFMPYITEAVFQRLYPNQKQPLMVTKW